MRGDRYTISTQPQLLAITCLPVSQSFGGGSYRVVYSSISGLLPTSQITRSHLSTFHVLEQSDEVRIMTNFFYIFVVIGRT